MNKYSRLSLLNPIHVLASGFGSGLIRYAPGTWGSLLGLVLGILLIKFIPFIYMLIVIAVSFLLGCYICQIASDDLNSHDHGSIVWDEIVAIWLVLICLPNTQLINSSLAFLLFRFFDIVKPFPINYFDEKVHNGFGIMLDDLIAAVYAIISCYILIYFLQFI